MKTRYPDNIVRTPTRTGTRSRGAGGFTLVELLVVIAIIGVMLALVFPMMAVMQKFTRGGAAESAIDVAVKTVRPYSAAYVADLGPINPAFAGAVYRGAAIVFAPGGDLRLVQNDTQGQAAEDMAGVVLEPNRCGYVDIAGIDYIRLPRSAGVVGITWGDDGTGSYRLLLLAPPFAIRFNPAGQLISGVDHATTGSSPPPSSRLVYYDGNYDGRYNINSTRLTAGPYNPALWDPRDPTNAIGTDPKGTGRYNLPFEEVETVVGVLVFQMNDFRGAGFKLTTIAGTRNLDSSVVNVGGQNFTATQWLMQTDASGQLVNAKGAFFSRYSGSLIRDYTP